MAEEMTNDLGTAEELKQSNRWLIKFNLSDAEILAVIELVGQVIWGDIDLDEFWQKIKTAVLKDEDIKRQIASAAANNRFLYFKDEIGDVEGFIKRLGGVVAPPLERAKIALSSEELNKKLSPYDWVKITGIERRALLEELGVGLKDFVKWFNENNQTDV